MSVAVLARLPSARIMRTRRGVIAVVWWTLFALGTIVIARQAHAASADLAMLDVYLPFVLPLVALALVAAALGGEGLVPAVRPLLRFGARPWASALATGIVASLACALVCSAVGALLVAVSHAESDPALGHDLLLTAYAGALAGGAHGAFFVLGSAFGDRGGGRGVALVLNWVLGAAPGWGAVLVPYSHARSLLGGAPVVTLSEPASAWCLAAIIVVCLALASARVRR